MNEYPCKVNVANGTHFVLIIDFTHEPWRSLALAMINHTNKELEDLGLTFENFDQLLDVIYQTKGDLQ